MAWMDKSPLVLTRWPGRGLLILDRKGNLWDTTPSLNFGEPASYWSSVVIIHLRPERSKTPSPCGSVGSYILPSVRRRQDRSQKPLIRHPTASLTRVGRITLLPCQSKEDCAFPTTTWEVSQAITRPAKSRQIWLAKPFLVV